MDDGGSCSRAEPDRSPTPLPACQQRVRIDTELLCERLDRIEGEIALAAFDGCEVAGRDPELLGKALLGEGATVALGTHVGAECLA